MDDPLQALAYARADFAQVNQGFVDRFRAAFPELMDGWFLDLGCGPCDIPIRLVRALPGCRVVAVDASRPMLNLAREALQKARLMGSVTLLCARLPWLGLRPGYFDAVLSNSLLHHLPEPWAFWETVKQQARPGAALLVMDLARPESEDRARAIVAAHAGSEDPVLQRDFLRSLLASFTPEEVTGQLRHAGLARLQARMVSDRHWAVVGRVE